MKFGEENLSEYIKCIKEEKPDKKKRAVVENLFSKLKTQFYKLSIVFSTDHRSDPKFNRRKIRNLNSITPLDIFKKEFPFINQPDEFYKSETESIKQIYFLKSEKRNEFIKKMKNFLE